MKYGAEISTSEVVGAIGEMSEKLDAVSLYMRVPLYKGKGDSLKCRNDRGISLLPVPGKVYGRILIDRVIVQSE